MNVLWAASRSMEKNIEQLANEPHGMIQDLKQRGKKRPADQLSSSPNHEPHMGYPVSTAGISQVMLLVSSNVSPSSTSVCFDSLPEPVETPDSGIPRVHAGFIKFQEYSRSFQEPEIEFSRSVCKEISMPYTMFQCFLC